MFTKTFMIQNKFGLHARPSASFVQTATRFRSEIKVEKDGQVADGKSILDLMTLAAAYGTFIYHKSQRGRRPGSLEGSGDADRRTVWRRLI